MITREYVTLFLLGSCFLLDYSSQMLVQAQERRTNDAVMSARRATATEGVRVSVKEVTLLKSRTKLRRHGMSKVQRVKRGWVWNQFFVLEEYMGSEPQYVGKLHSDMDHGDNAVKYILSGEGAGSVFTIDQITGDIHALVRLDREEKSDYTLKAQAIDIHTGLPLEPESEFIIKVQDINDNEPRFPDGPYSGSVPEMSPSGTYVTQVTAIDADDPTYGNSARIVYSILHGQPYFSVDPKTGTFHFHVPESASVGSIVGHIQAHDLDADSNAEVDYVIVPGNEGNMFDIIFNGQSQEGVIVLKKTLDYETKKSYTFKDSATVKVNVLDIEEPPLFTKTSYSMDVYEDTPPGTIIGSVTAHDLDASSSAVRYSLEWHTESDSCFDIDTIEGTISTNDYIDRETAVKHNITAVATKVNNPLLSTKVSVIVNILDVNEFPPELAVPSDTFVCENSGTGQVIQMVSAVDKDLPPVGQRFFFKTPKELRNRNFTVRDFGNNTAGIVTRRSGFQRQLQDVFFVPIVVEDSGYPAQSSTATLTIQVCSCEMGGPLLACSAEAIFLPVDLSIGASMAILLCIILLIVMAGLYMNQKQQKMKETLMASKEDIRDNVIHYDDEGGGEADTHAFDMGTLCNTHSQYTSTYSSTSKKEKNGYGDGVLRHLTGRCEDVRSPDIHRETASVIVGVNNKAQLTSSGRVTGGDAENIREFIEHRLEESHPGYAALPYDSLATYAYEGDGSVAGSLSSIEEPWLCLQLRLQRLSGFFFFFFSSSFDLPRLHRAVLWAVGMMSSLEAPALAFSSERTLHLLTCVPAAVMQYLQQLQKH
ncbi:hypothetical protein INR49_031214 [Caranx melampygus]|nr:hypothetical protein INR49_031214 [Caranx melampygus]